MLLALEAYRMCCLHSKDSGVRACFSIRLLAISSLWDSTVMMFWREIWHLIADSASLSDLNTSAVVSNTA